MQNKTINDMLNPKQLDFIFSDDARINLLSGAVRSGKTYISLLKWAIFVGSMPQGTEFLMTGKTITALKRNCLGLLQDLVGKKNFNYSISNKSGKLFGHTIWLEGASDDRAESKIRGMTLAGAYVDELTQIPFEFYTMLLSRLSVKNAKLYATTNPDAPTHWVKTDIIDNQEINKKVWNFQFDDNEILKHENEEYFENLRKEYEVLGEVFYQRFILGLWVLAEGLIYKQFANNKKMFIVDKAIDDNGNKKNFMIITIGVDYGASKSTTRFICNGITTCFKEVWALDEMKIEGVYTPEMLYEKFELFYNKIVGEYGKVTHVFCDYGALGQTLTYGLNRYLQRKSIPIQARDCIKGKIIDRIYMDQTLFARGKRKILKKCLGLIEAYEQAVWNSKIEDERLDDGTSDIDSLDANEYSYFPFYDKLINDIK